MKTTLNKIKKHNPCENGWKKLLTFLNKTEADDEELSLLTILESNGLKDALWALQTVQGHNKEIRLMACDFAESVVHLVSDERSVNAIKVSRDFANGLVTIIELIAACAAAWDARAADRHTAEDTKAAAVAAAWAADWDTKAAATGATAWAAVAAARDVEIQKQIEIFKKYVKE